MLDPQDLSRDGQTTREIYTVTRLNREAKAILEGSFPMIWIDGELSNIARPASGHIYFTLKDENSQVRCAMFRTWNRLLEFTPDNGMQVLLRARVGLYEGRGEFQIVVEHMEPTGDGALRRAFEELKQRLFKEGLFEEKHKLPLPMVPECLGVITSPTGAAIRDILSILKRRFPAIPIIIYPVPVQGRDAAPQIAKAIGRVELEAQCDVVILARGGGSLEDLWAFNEEMLARAIYACKVPIVTGIGHEIDFTIADFVADVRAPTPSASAELVSPDQWQLNETLTRMEFRLQRYVQGLLRERRQALGHLTKRIPHPVKRLHDIAQRVDDLAQRYGLAMQTAWRAKLAALREFSAHLQRQNPMQTLKMHGQRCAHYEDRLRRMMVHTLQALTVELNNMRHALETVSPLATLDRGYAIVTRLPDGAVVRDAKALKKGKRVRARFAKGHAHATVDELFDE